MRLQILIANQVKYEKEFPDFQFKCGRTGRKAAFEKREQQMVRCVAAIKEAYGIEDCQVVAVIGSRFVCNEIVVPERDWVKWIKKVA